MAKKVAEPIKGNFIGKDILSMSQFDASSLTLLFKHTDKMKKIAQNSKPSDILKGTMSTLLFFEPSSRTFGSFTASINQLGGHTIDILNPQAVSSVAKGETLEDTMKTFEAYSDAIIMRHPEIGSAMRAAQAVQIPVLNAGDGIGEHPTQALLDLYTIQNHTGRLTDLTGLIAGDMMNGRTVHSLLKGLSLFKGNTIYLLSPKELRLSKEYLSEVANKNLKIIEIEKETDIPTNANFWYWTRVQKERFKDLESYEKTKHRFVVTP